MKKSPPITEFYRYPVTAGTALLAIFVTVLDMTGRSIEQLVMSVRAFEDQPFRLVTSALPHADPIHLIFNVIWLWVFGTTLEERFGPFRLLGLIVAFAVGSAAAEYAIFRGGIGLSGVVYGLFGLLWVLSRADSKLRGALDDRNALLFVVWFFVCIAATVMDVWHIANVAHGVGWLLGLLAGLMITGGLRLGRPRASIRAASILGFVVVIAASLTAAGRFRSRVNFAQNGGADIAQLGFQALEAGHYDEAITRYKSALAVSPEVDTTWYNLGVAYWHKGNMDEATKAFARVRECATDDEDGKKLRLDATTFLAQWANSKGDYAEAAKLYEEAVAKGASDVPTFFSLGLAYKNLGRTDEALQMFNRAAKLDPSLAGYAVEQPALPPDAGAEEVSP